MARRYQDGGVVADGKQLRHSFSGHERNHLFLNRDGKRFDDVSVISGLDNIADSRAFVYWDYDRDGWQDIALVNANYPLLNFYRNEIGSDPRIAMRNRLIDLRFVPISWLIVSTRTYWASIFSKNSRASRSRVFKSG